MHIFNKIMAIMFFICIPVAVVMGGMYDVVIGGGFRSTPFFIYLLPILFFCAGLLMIYWGKEEEEVE
jgi:surface polysaccharide O-acyltransferase-like enzyme